MKYFPLAGIAYFSFLCYNNVSVASAIAISMLCILYGFLEWLESTKVPDIRAEVEESLAKFKEELDKREEKNKEELFKINDELSKVTIHTRTPFNKEFRF